MDSCGVAISARGTLGAIAYLARQFSNTTYSRMSSGCSPLVACWTASRQDPYQYCTVKRVLRELQRGISVKAGTYVALGFALGIVFSLIFVLDALGSIAVPGRIIWLVAGVSLIVGAVRTTRKKPIL